MRIIAGKLKGKKLLLPSDNTTRPLRDLVKESIFNLITHSNKINFKIENSNILDLFSGTGSFGLECLSRGANHVTFFENYLPAINILKKNIQQTKLENSCKLHTQDCFTFFEEEKKNHNYDLIFMDPPFKESRVSTLIEMIKDKNILKKNGVIIIHRHKSDQLMINMSITVIDQRKYGISKITVGI